MVPLGSCEQHGPHLPVSVDTVVAEAVTSELSIDVPGVVVGPTLAYGASGEHGASQAQFRRATRLSRLSSSRWGVRAALGRSSLVRVWSWRQPRSAGLGDDPAPTRKARCWPGGCARSQMGMPMPAGRKPLSSWRCTSYPSVSSVQKPAGPSPSRSSCRSSVWAGSAASPRMEYSVIQTAPRRPRVMRCSLR